MIYALRCTLWIHGKRIEDLFRFRFKNFFIFFTEFPSFNLKISINTITLLKTLQSSFSNSFFALQKAPRENIRTEAKNRYFSLAKPERLQRRRFQLAEKNNGFSASTEAVFSGIFPCQGKKIIREHLKSHFLRVLVSYL